MSPRNLFVTFVSSLLLFAAMPVMAQAPAKPEAAPASEAGDVPTPNSTHPDDDGSEWKPRPESKSASGKRSGSKVFPDDVLGLQKLAIESYENKDYMRFVQANIKLRELRPYEPQYMIGMVVGAALINRPRTAYNYMHVMQQQGLAYDFNSTEDTQSLRATEVYKYLNDLLIKAGEPKGEGRVAFKLPKTALRPEAIAWDDARGSFLVGTVDTGALLEVSPSGTVKELLKANRTNGLMAINGIAIDQQRNKLWITTAGLPGFAALKKADIGRGLLLEFNLETLEPLGRFEIPADGVPHVPGSVVVNPAGDVYLIDRAVPVVYRKPVGQALAAYLANPVMVGLRDLAISTDGNKLYLADAAMGIMVVDLVNSKASQLAGPETLNLSGLSGIMFADGKLLVLQNGIQPQRLMRLDLDPTGMAVVNSSPLAIALEEFNAPAFGVVQGGAVYYFASSNLADPGEKQTIVMKTPMELTEEIVTPELRKFNEETPAATGKQGTQPATSAAPDHAAPLTKGKEE